MDVLNLILLISVAEIVLVGRGLRLRLMLVNNFNYKQLAASWLHPEMSDLSISPSEIIQEKFLFF